jgi:thiol-disulfide isomerase/thioredoxin
MNRKTLIASGIALTSLLSGFLLWGRTMPSAMAMPQQEPPTETAVRNGSLVTLNHPVPALTGEASLWLNTEKPITFEKGKVYVVHFWTFSCINCKRNLPSYERWYKRFGKDVTFIGVHTPETESEKKFENVKEAVKKNDIKYPVLFDPKSENWKRWQQQWWPTVYLIDKQGRVRYYWMGELEWQGAGGDGKMRNFLTQLVNEKAK